MAFPFPSRRSSLAAPALLLALTACDSGPLATPGPASGRAAGAAVEARHAGGTAVRGGEAPSAGAPAGAPGAPQQRPQPADADATALVGES